MGWERYLRMNWATAAEFNDLEAKLAQQRHKYVVKTVEQHARIAELEADLGRVALLARSLADVCLKKGLLSEAELHAQMLASDLEDGIGDQRLDPKVVMPGESKLADLEPLVTKPRIPPRKRL
jgi:hypothetical protein